MVFWNCGARNDKTTAGGLRVQRLTSGRTDVFPEVTGTPYGDRIQSVRKQREFRFF